MRGARPFRLIFAVAALVLVGSFAQAHHTTGGADAPETSLSIPSLSHGQMIVIANHRAEILDLADKQAPTDPVMRRLQGFIALQSFACLWGWVPGSVTDEASPFNECAHAYLAATRLLLLHLQTMPGDRTAVRALIAQIEIEMLTNQASLSLCRFSDEPFNTAERIDPNWRDVPFHAPSVLTLGGAVALALACAGIGGRALARFA